MIRAYNSVSALISLIILVISLCKLVGERDCTDNVGCLTISHIILLIIHDVQVLARMRLSQSRDNPIVIFLLFASATPRSSSTSSCNYSKRLRVTK
jgi:hypothetical protein